MIPPARHTSIRANTATLLAIAISAIAIARLAAMLLRMPAPISQMPTSPSGGISSPTTANTMPLAGLTDTMKAVKDAAREGELARRFRLAGTILGVSNSGADDPIAIIDDRVTVTQSIVQRNKEVIPGVMLVQVRTTSMVLRGPAGEEEIFLDKSGRDGSDSGDASGTHPPDGTAGETGKFGGGQVFPNRWEFERGALLNYYAELRDQPERLLTIFDSMDPVYVTDLDGERRITGYVVGVEGEPDFFAGAGLSNGDIVRSVNSVSMTNRRRAEAFIQSFVEGTVSTFVLEVEREGKTSKQVYVIK